ncbi:hypothetical protein GCM10027521_19810 [Amycolatopsis cihanbeyliensis]
MRRGYGKEQLLLVQPVPAQRGIVHRHGGDQREVDGVADEAVQHVLPGALHQAEPDPRLLRAEAAQQLRHVGAAEQVQEAQHHPAAFRRDLLPHLPDATVQDGQRLLRGTRQQRAHPGQPDPPAVRGGERRADPLGQCRQPPAGGRLRDAEQLRRPSEIPCALEHSEQRQPGGQIPGELPIRLLIRHGMNDASTAY